MRLITPELEKQFPPLYSTEGNDPKEVKIIAKFFDPCSNWSWYATEFDSQDKIFFGLVKGFEIEFGYFSLDELESIKGRFGLGIERDLYFGEHTLADVIEKKL